MAPAIALCRPGRACAAAGPERSTGTSIAPAVSRAATSAATSASPQVPGAVTLTLTVAAVPPAPVAADVRSVSHKNRANQTPAIPPASAATAHSGTTSAAASRVSCQRVAPRAVSSAVSLSRWVTSSLAAASVAATESTSSCRPLITSSALATARLSPMSASTTGRLVVSCTPLSVSESLSEFWSAVWSAAIADRSVPVKAAMSGCITQVAPLAASAAPNAAGATRSGP